MHAHAPGVQPRRADRPHDAPRPHITSAPQVGDIVVTKGRHAGKRLRECPPDFLAWLATSSTCPTYRVAAADLLGMKAVPAEPQKSDRRKADRDAGDRPAVLTDDHVNEILGVLFKLADELDSVRERLHEAETRLCRAEIALEHLGFDLDAPKPTEAS